jgi:hypothetical protein
LSGRTINFTTNAVADGPVITFNGYQYQVSCAATGSGGISAKLLFLDQNSSTINWDGQETIWNVASSVILSTTDLATYGQAAGAVNVGVAAGAFLRGYIPDLHIWGSDGTSQDVTISFTANLATTVPAGQSRCMAEGSIQANPS